MRQARGLLPYAAVAVLIVGATVAALVLSTLAAPVSLQEPAPASATAAPTAAVRPATDLSPAGRLAYWRTEANGDYVLWLANADNSRRRSVAKTAQANTISRTKWSLDGHAIAYVESGVRLNVVRVDGATSVFTLAPDLRADGYRIVDHRFSPSGDRIAATVQRATGSQSDVYVSAGAGTWTRLTATEDVLAADWISEDELLVQTTGGIVARLRATGRDQVRPLTGLPSATPVIGDDGRVYFLSGRVSGFAGTSETLVLAAAASIWSATVDGEDLRRESTPLESDSFRLDGVLPGGSGFLLHRGTNPAQLAIGKSGPLDVPASTGLVERMQVSPDRRFAIGFAGSNLVRLDFAANGSIANTVVLLGSVSQGDAWFPRTVALSRVSVAPADVPAARYVFALGGHLWTMGTDGVPSLLRGGNTNAQTLRRFSLPAPQWSPSGDRVLTAESLAAGGAAFQLIPVTIARDGTVRRYTTPSSIGTTFTWSPDGKQIAVTSLSVPPTDPSILTSELSISVLDATTGGVARSIGGREAYWTKAGILVISNGTFRPGDRARSDQTLELVASDGAKRQVATVARVVADPRTQAPSETRGLTQASGLTASSDGAYASVHVAFLSATTGSASFAILRTSDGAPTAIVARDSVNDEAWSPAGRYLGYTQATGAFNVALRQRAVVRDAETGEVVFEQDGRFAGWSPDGSWAYIARAEGLFARKLAGGDAMRFSPYGVVVAATAP